MAEEVLLCFGKRKYYVEEGGCVEVALIRTGKMSKQLRIRVASNTKSSRFHNVQKTLTFAADQHMATFIVRTKDDTIWNRVSTMQVCVTDAEIQTSQDTEHPTTPLQPVKLPMVHNDTTTSITVINDDLFPNLVTGKVNKNTFASKLMWAFIKERWRARRPKAIRTVAALCTQTVHGTR
jgi:hypothetical protein